MGVVVPGTVGPLGVVVSGAVGPVGDAVWERDARRGHEGAAGSPRRGAETAPLFSMVWANPRSGAGTARQPNPGQLRSSGGFGEVASGAELPSAGGRDGAQTHGNPPSLSLVAGGCGCGFCAQLEKDSARSTRR